MDGAAKSLADIHALEAAHDALMGYGNPKPAIDALRAAMALRGYIYDWRVRGFVLK